MLSKSRGEAYRLMIANVYELAGTSRRTSSDIATPAGLTVAGWHLLSVLQDGPVTVPRAAARLGQSRQAVQRVADALVRTGHLHREDNERHVRSPRMAVTEDGRRALRTVVSASDDRRERELHDVSVEDLLAARVVLQRVLAAIDPDRRP